MVPELLQKRIRQSPFRPFRVLVSDGRAYEVLHPEMILMTQNAVTIALYDRSQRPGEAIPERDITISLLHVTSTEEISHPSSVTGNGNDQA